MNASDFYHKNIRFEKIKQIEIMTDIHEICYGISSVLQVRTPMNYLRDICKVCTYRG